MESETENRAGPLSQLSDATLQLARLRSKGGTYLVFNPLGWNDLEKISNGD